MNIFTYPTTGLWERERAGQRTTNFTLSLPFGILLRDSQLPGNKKEGIGLADPNATATASAAAAAAATMTVDTAGTAPSSSSSPSPTLKTNPKTPNALAVDLGLGIPLGVLLVACLALLFRQQRKLKEERAVTPPPPSLHGTEEKSHGYNTGSYTVGTYDAQELPEHHRAVPEPRGEEGQQSS